MELDSLIVHLQNVSGSGVVVVVVVVMKIVSAIFRNLSQSAEVDTDTEGTLILA